MNKDILIFIVEDDTPVNLLITKYLEKQGFHNIRSFYSSEEMMGELKADKDIIIIQDYDLPGKNGLDTIIDIKPHYPQVDFIFLSGQKSIEIAIDALKNGAFDYIVKDNFAKENVLVKIQNLIRIKALQKDKLRFRNSLIVFSILLLISWIIMLIEFIKN